MHKWLLAGLIVFSYAASAEILFSSFDWREGAIVLKLEKDKKAVELRGSNTGDTVQINAEGVNAYIHVYAQAFVILALSESESDTYEVIVLERPQGVFTPINKKVRITGPVRSLNLDIANLTKAWEHLAEEEFQGARSEAIRAMVTWFETRPEKERVVSGFLDAVELGWISKKKPRPEPEVIEPESRPKPSQERRRSRPPNARIDDDEMESGGEGSEREEPPYRSSTRPPRMMDRNQDPGRSQAGEGVGDPVRLWPESGGHHLGYRHPAPDPHQRPMQQTPAQPGYGGSSGTIDPSDPAYPYYYNRYYNQWLLKPEFLRRGYRQPEAPQPGIGYHPG
ncbi:MAG: hypothetical protein AB7P49_12270, partial [Bdellovibrionales bacterium]